MSEIKTLIEHLSHEYTEPGMSPAGEPPVPSQLEQDMAEAFGSDTAARMAKMGILKFAEFAEQYMRDNPPQQQIMLSEGMGVMLQNGVEVSLHDPAIPPGYVEDADSVAVSGIQRGRGGMERSGAVPVTGKKPSG